MSFEDGLDAAATQALDYVGPAILTVTAVAIAFKGIVILRKVIRMLDQMT